MDTVRDPLSRILSAYLDKFNTDNTIVAEYYKRWYGRYIMNTYQGGAASKESQNYKGIVFYLFSIFLQRPVYCALNPLTHEMM